LRGTEVAKVTIVTIAAPVLLCWSVLDMDFHGKVGWKWLEMETIVLP
jgi:hypothetical protein